MAKKGPKKKSRVTIHMPMAAWDVLRETLELDSESPAVDLDLRREISKALRSVKVIRTVDVAIDYLRSTYGSEYAGFGKEGPREWSPGETMIILSVPQEGWSTLRETLYLDSESGAFDEDLREQIAVALKLILVEI